MASHGWPRGWPSQNKRPTVLLAMAGHGWSKVWPNQFNGPTIWPAMAGHGAGPARTNGHAILKTRAETKTKLRSLSKFRARRKVFPTKYSCSAESGPPFERVFHCNGYSGGSRRSRLCSTKSALRLFAGVKNVFLGLPQTRLSTINPKP